MIYVNNNSVELIVGERDHRFNIIRTMIVDDDAARIHDVAIASYQLFGLTCVFFTQGREMVRFSYLQSPLPVNSPLR